MCILYTLTDPNDMSGHIISPLTNRPIKIGGVTWRRLVADGLVTNQKPDNELYQADSREEAKVAVKIYKKKNKDSTRNVVIARDGKRIITARKRTTNKQVSENMGIASARVLKKIQSGELSMPDDATDEEVEQFVQQQVLNELMGLASIKPVAEANGYDIQTPAPSDEEYSGDEGDYSE